MSTQRKNRSGPRGNEGPPVLGSPDRRTAVLYAVVTEYIRTGLPSGSRTLAETYGLDLSPATVRSVLKELEDENLLTQPHTSAGRLPTERALRLYIDALLSAEERQGLSRRSAERIRRFVQDRELAPGSRGAAFARDVGELLSELSGNPAVILQSRSETSLVRKIRFIPTRPHELLAVVVLDDGTVENRFIQVDAGVGASELERIHNLLDEYCGQSTLLELREELGRLPGAEPNPVGALGQLGETLVRSTLAELGSAPELVIAGRTNLLGEAAHPERTRQMLIVLEDKERLVRLLDRVIGSDRIQVFLGKDTETGPGDPVSLVATGFRQTGGLRGAMGVLGPPEMNYPGLIPLLTGLAHAIRASADDEVGQDNQ